MNESNGVIAIMEDDYHAEKGRIRRTFLRGALVGSGATGESKIDLELDVKYTISYPTPVEYEFGKVVSALGTLDVDEEGLKLVDATVTYLDGKTKSGGTFYIALSKNPFFSRIK